MNNFSGNSDLIRIPQNDEMVKFISELTGEAFIVLMSFTLYLEIINNKLVVSDSKIFDHFAKINHQSINFSDLRKHIQELIDKKIIEEINIDSAIYYSLNRKKIPFEICL